MKTVLRKASISLFPFVGAMFYGSRTELKEGKRLLVFPLLKSLLLVKSAALSLLCCGWCWNDDALKKQF